MKRRRFRTTCGVRSADEVDGAVGAVSGSRLAAIGCLFIGFALVGGVGLLTVVGVVVLGLIGHWFGG